MANEDLSKLKINKPTITNAPAKNKKNIIYSSVAVVLILVIVLLLLSGALTPAIKVQVSTVSEIYPSQTFTMLNASGYIVPQRKAAVASKITGQLIALYVEEGTRVKKHAIIARLESEDVSALRKQAVANLAQADAELADAKIAFNRSSELLKQGFISRAELDTAEARYKKAFASHTAFQAALQGAEASLDYTLIRAPFDAVVLTKNADVGDIVTPLGAAANAKASVVTLADMASLQIEVDVSETNINKITIGQPCDIQLDALSGMHFQGKVHMIVPTADRSKATVMVKVRFVDRDQRILPEMSAKVAFLSREVAQDERKPITAVNASALVTKNSTTSLFVLQGEKVKETAVQTGRQLGDMVEIVSGVKAGDKVVLKPDPGLRDGATIKTDDK